MFELLTQPSSIVLEIANVRAILFRTQDDNNTNREISEIESEYHGVSTLSSAIEEDDLEHLQQVLLPDKARRDNTI
jgi:hypothetical protein